MASIRYRLAVAGYSAVGACACLSLLACSFCVSCGLLLLFLRPRGVDPGAIRRSARRLCVVAEHDNRRA